LAPLAILSFTHAGSAAAPPRYLPPVRLFSCRAAVFTVSLASIACSTVACGAGAGLHASNGAKMGEALAFAAVAAAAQVALSAAEQNARNSAPVTHASYGTGGVAVAQDCDNQGQYGCVTVTPSFSDPPEPVADLNDEDLRDYVLGYVNGVRKLNAVAPVAREEAMDAFAQAGSDALSTDHKQNQHMTEHARELHGASAELQGSPDGARPGARQDRIAEILLAWMAEGKGGMHHDTLLRGDWTRLGVGLATRDGRLYFTVDLATP
jgi:uncharacterized protein YkwD